MRISKTTNDRGKQFARELEEFFVSYHQAQRSHGQSRTCGFCLSRVEI